MVSNSEAALAIDDTPIRVTEQLGPKYFGCVRMVQLNFFYFLLMLEFIYMGITIERILNHEINQHNVVPSVVYLIVLNILPTCIMLRIIYLYKKFDEELICDNRSTSVLLCASNFFMGMLTIRITIFAALAMCVVFDVHEFEKYSIFYHSIQQVEKLQQTDLSPAQEENFRIFSFLIFVPCFLFHAYILYCFKRILDQLKDMAIENRFTTIIDSDQESQN